MYTLTSEEYPCDILRKGFKEILATRYRWYDVWKMMNEVKALPLIPGINAATVYQVADYFEVPLRYLRNVEKKHHLEDPLHRHIAHDDELSFLAIGKKPVQFEGVRHFQYDFKGFSVHIAPSGAVCYTPQAIISFLPYIEGSQVCSTIVYRLAKQYVAYKSHSYDRYYDGFRVSILEYEEKMQKEQEEKEREEEAKRITEKVYAELQKRGCPAGVRLSVTVNPPA